jgi:NADPH2:quinone reductase
LGWGSHCLDPLSFRGASYSGVFTLFPLLTGENRAHHGRILASVAKLAEAGKPKPLLSEQRFSVNEIGSAHTLVAAGTVGKIVVEF